MFDNDNDPLDINFNIVNIIRSPKKENIKQNIQNTIDGSVSKEIQPEDHLGH